MTVLCRINPWWSRCWAIPSADRITDVESYHPERACGRLVPAGGGQCPRSGSQMRITGGVVITRISRLAMIIKTGPNAAAFGPVFEMDALPSVTLPFISS